MKNADKPAMPVVRSAYTYHGMSKREKLVESAMVALLSNPAMIDGLHPSQIDWLVDSSIKVADRILDTLETQNE